MDDYQQDEAFRVSGYFEWVLGVEETLLSNSSWFVQLKLIDQETQGSSYHFGGQPQGSSKLRCSYPKGLVGLVHCGNIPPYLHVGTCTSTGSLQAFGRYLSTYVMAPLSVAPSLLTSHTSAVHLLSWSHHHLKSN